MKKLFLSIIILISLSTLAQKAPVIVGTYTTNYGKVYKVYEDSTGKRYYVRMVKKNGKEAHFKIKKQKSMRVTANSGIINMKKYTSKMKRFDDGPEAAEEVAEKTEETATTEEKVAEGE